MNLESQVCSLELAKKLKELGVKQESYFVWHGGNKEWAVLPRKLSGSNISAFTVAELGQILPKGYWDEISVNGGYEVGYSQSKPMTDENIDRYFVVEPSEADARAKMLIYLLQNKLIPLP